VVGNYMAPGMEIDIALRTYDILRRARGCSRKPPSLPVAKRKTKKTHRPAPSAVRHHDGEDAATPTMRLLRQARQLRLFSGGWKLFVAIADVPAT
jgi:ribonuclease R